MAGPLIAAVLAFSVPDSRLDIHLYLGTDGESECIRKAFEISRETVSEPYRRLACIHERLRADIAKVASLHFHELPSRYPNCPHWSLSRYDTPQRFGWIRSQRTGRPVRAWQDTAGILRHLRYIALLADNQRQNRPNEILTWNRLRADCGECSARLSVFGPCRELRVYPPMRHRTVFEAEVRTPWLKVTVETPYARRWTSDEVTAARRYLDMGTGLVPE
jgi:hypothetical protein